jgi:hypothetical protein
MMSASLLGPYDVGNDPRKKQTLLLLVWTLLHEGSAEPCNSRCSSTILTINPPNGSGYEC